MQAASRHSAAALALATVISWACTNNAHRHSQDSNVAYFKGLMHTPTHIQLGLLRHVLLEKQTTAFCKIVDVTFEGKSLPLQGLNVSPHNQDVP
jgi:hypothetical protein